MSLMNIIWIIVALIVIVLLLKFLFGILFITPEAHGFVVHKSINFTKCTHAVYRSSVLYSCLGSTTNPKTKVYVNIINP